MTEPRQENRPTDGRYWGTADRAYLTPFYMNGADDGARITLQWLDGHSLIWFCDTLPEAHADLRRLGYMQPPEIGRAHV